MVLSATPLVFCKLQFYVWQWIAMLSLFFTIQCTIFLVAKLMYIVVFTYVLSYHHLWQFKNVIFFILFHILSKNTCYNNSLTLHQKAKKMLWASFGLTTKVEAWQEKRPKENQGMRLVFRNERQPHIKWKPSRMKGQHIPRTLLREIPILGPKAPWDFRMLKSPFGDLNQLQNQGTFNSLERS
jgi:hypothetical protein